MNNKERLELVIWTLWILVGALTDKEVIGSRSSNIGTGPGKLLQNLVRVIADLRGKFWPDLGPEIADLRLQSGHLGANCVRL